MKQHHYIIGSTGETETTPEWLLIAGMALSLSLSAFFWGVWLASLF